MSHSSSSPKPITGRFVLGVIVAFFTVVIGVNITMMNLAISTLPGTDVDSAYRGSLDYQHEIDAAREQEGRDWKVDASVVRHPDGKASLEVAAHDRDGQPLAGLAFSARLERPADKRADVAVAFAESAAGLYRGSVAEIAAGQWDLVLEGDAAGKRVFLSKNRLVLD